MQPMKGNICIIFCEKNNMTVLEKENQFHKAMQENP